MSATGHTTWHLGQAADRQHRDTVERRQRAQATLREIARDEGMQWLLREVQVMALWSEHLEN